MSLQTLFYLSYDTQPSCVNLKVIKYVGWNVQQKKKIWKEITWSFFFIKFNVSYHMSNYMRESFLFNIFIYLLHLHSRTFCFSILLFFKRDCSNLFFYVKDINLLFFNSCQFSFKIDLIDRILYRLWVLSMSDKYWTVFLCKNDICIKSE